MSWGITNLLTEYQAHKEKEFDSVGPTETVLEAAARGATIEIRQEYLRNNRPITRNEFETAVLDTPQGYIPFTKFSFEVVYDGLNNRTQIFERHRVVHKKPCGQWIYENLTPILTAVTAAAAVASVVALRTFKK